MKAYQLRGPREGVVCEVPKPEAGKGVLIRVMYAGICGSDLTIYLGKHARAKFPLIPGHEFAGVIEEIGTGVQTDLKPGDRVTANPLYSCGHCRACLSGNEHVCSDLKLIGIDCDGGMAEYVSVPLENIYRLPDSISWEIAAIVEPVAVIIHGMRQLAPSYYMSSVVTGAGPIGLLSALLLRRAGVKNILVSEVNPDRRETAKKLGFSVADPRMEPLEETVKRAFGGADLVVEASGSDPCAADLTKVADPKAKILQLGVFKHPVPLDLQAVSFKELTLIGSRVYTKLDFSDAINYVAAHPEEMETVVSHRLPLDEAPNAMELALNGADGAMKVMLRCGADDE